VIDVGEAEAGSGPVRVESGMEGRMAHRQLADSLGFAIYATVELHMSEVQS
jgi:hypothetical protein